MKNSLISRNRGSNFKIKMINNFSIPKEKNKKLKFKSSIIRNNKKLIIIFAGNIGRFQSLDTVIDAMIFLKNRKDIQLIIIGEGSVKSSLVCKVKKNNANVLFLNHQPAPKAFA
jgi:glycosyltransferase involved in cell wall biosynthesis